MIHPEQILHRIKNPDDVKTLSDAELQLLVQEVRDHIVWVMSQNPGHFGASMGVVELTIALHKVFDLNLDKLVWDVGHQAYAHKILTNRKIDFQSIRTTGGISGFPKMSESEYDHFGTGHSSTSIGAALGMAVADKIQGQSNYHIAVIGDGALTGGMAFEALNNIRSNDVNLIVVLNDNGMSIDENVGGLDHHLKNIGATADNWFTNLGLDYSGPIDGHDLQELSTKLEELKSKGGAHLLHIKTEKGKGFKASEEGDATTWHAPGKFDSNSGRRFSSEKEFPKKYQDVAGHALTQIASKDDSICVITPAMKSGSGLTQFAELYPDRFFDVGIAEQHAVTFSAGLAAKGLRPYCAIYSSFLQRGYDQVIHDVALQKLNVTFCLDRAGLVGADGPTHHGAFDIAFLKPIPNLQIWTPRNEEELHNMMDFSIQSEGPIAIRYPRGKGELNREVQDLPEYNLQPETLLEGTEAAILSFGPMHSEALKAIEILKEDNISIALIDMKIASPIDSEFLSSLSSKFDRIFTIEDGVTKGGAGESIAAKIGHQSKVVSLGIPDEFIPHGTQNELYASIGLDASGIANELKKELISAF